MFLQKSKNVFCKSTKATNLFPDLGIFLQYSEIEDILTVYFANNTINSLVYC